MSTAIILKTQKYNSINAFDYIKIMELAKPEYRLFYKIMWYLGLRISEILALRKEDLISSSDGYFLRVYRLKRRRNRGKADLIPLDPVLALEIDNYIKLFQIKDRLFEFNRFTINQQLRKIGKLIGKKLHPHMFRHGRVYDLISKGAHPLAICRLMGWENLNNIFKYYHPSDDDIRRLITL